jgi:antitoxin FitA
MSIMIEIRNVPEDLHREAKARAAREGLTPSDFALWALEREVRRSIAADLPARIRSLEPVPDAPSGAALVREARDSR